MHFHGTIPVFRSISIIFSLYPNENLMVSLGYPQDIGVSKKNLLVQGVFFHNPNTNLNGIIILGFAISFQFSEK